MNNGQRPASFWTFRGSLTERLLQPNTHLRRCGRASPWRGLTGRRIIS